MDYFFVISKISKVSNLEYSQKLNYLHIIFKKSFLEIFSYRRKIIINRIYDKQKQKRRAGGVENAQSILHAGMPNHKTMQPKIANGNPFYQ